MTREQFFHSLAQEHLTLSFHLGDGVATIWIAPDDELAIASAEAQTFEQALTQLMEQWSVVRT